MCTLVLVHRLVPDLPVVVLANRDEFLSRPAAPPALRLGPPRVVCGLDVKAGGTWFGINEHGLMVGLTNLTLRPPDPERRSRGLLCMDMLRMPSAERVREALERLEPCAYNPFNLVAADAETACRARYDDAVQVASLDPGVHATSNWPLGSEGDGKRVLVAERVQHAVEASRSVLDLLAALRGIGRTHDGNGNPVQSVCCHAPGYGTRSSTVVAMGARGAGICVQHSEGPPCESRYDDLTHIAAPLFEPAT